MITDAAVETATAVLEERGWERDDEMVEDVRAALEAAQAEPLYRECADDLRESPAGLGDRPPESRDPP